MSELIEKLVLNALIALSFVVLRGILIRLYKARKETIKNDNFIVGINTIMLILLSILLFVSIMQLFNVDIKQFFTSISIIAAAIAIISKDYISNAINGMILMFNTHISIGDYVRIGDQKGKISHLTLINVHLLNEENDLILIPNNVVFSTQIINYTKGDTRKAQLELPLPIVMVENMDSTERLFKEAIMDLQHKVSIGSFTTRIVTIEPDGVYVKMSVLLHETDKETEIEVRRRWLNKWSTLKQQLS